MEMTNRFFYLSSMELIVQNKFFLVFQEAENSVQYQIKKLGGENFF